MDAGVAAVLGALAGAVATTGAAFATGWSAREQAKIAARGEHRRQRRDSRQVVYEEFIATATTQEAHAARFFLAPVPTDQETFDLALRGSGNADAEALWNECHRRWTELLKLSTRVKLAGPRMMSEAASAVCDCSHDVMESTMTVDHGLIGGEPISVRFEQGREHWIKLDHAIDEFIEKARISLDDDGTD
ncbi:hypothetical protein [Streptomyces guryensis]|uniref:Uncharacterized protein n=1 Tax=Streptomyces guryensis TaxID=2886947 RepID=A0A9Q3VWF4_9ACTN|nr:hypothetical protein [Streptomyces guryensis]MCD9879676.1 hypothetical protein [Streptomyces guryensis]